MAKQARRVKIEFKRGRTKVQVQAQSPRGSHYTVDSGTFITDSPADSETKELIATALANMLEGRLSPR